MTASALTTRATVLFGVDYPIVQTGMGWVSGPRLTSATANAGGLGILASATMSYGELAAAISETKSRTSRPFGVNLRADAPDAADRVDLLAREGVRVASFALAPKQDLIKRCKDHGLVVVPSIGARRHAEKVGQVVLIAKIDDRYRRLHLEREVIRKQVDALSDTDNASLAALFRREG